MYSTLNNTQVKEIIGGFQAKAIDRWTYKGVAASNLKSRLLPFNIKVLWGHVVVKSTWAGITTTVESASGAYPREV